MDEKLQDLQQAIDATVDEARRRAEELGHSLGSWEYRPKRDYSTFVAQCSTCRMPIQIDIHGETHQAQISDMHSESPLLLLPCPNRTR